MRLRWVRIAACALLLGVLLTVATAWTACLAWDQPMPSESFRTSASGAGWEVTIFRGIGVQKTDLFAVGADGVGPGPRGHSWEVRPREALPRRARVPPTPEELRRRVVESEIRAGWPTHALHGRAGFDRADGTVWIDGMVDLRSVAWWGPESRLTVLPRRPLWPGFLVCVAHWAMVAALCLLVPGAIRRVVNRRRVRLGRCPGCAFPREGLAPAAPCPECGAAGKGAESA